MASSFLREMHIVRFGLVYVVKSQFVPHNIFFMFHKSTFTFNFLGNVCVLVPKKLVEMFRGRIRVHFSKSLRTPANTPETEIRKFNENQSFSVKTRKDTFHNKLTSLTKEGVHNPHPETEIRKFHENKRWAKL